MQLTFDSDKFCLIEIGAFAARALAAPEGSQQLELAPPSLLLRHKVNYTLLKNEERVKGCISTPDKYFLTIECFKMMGMQVSGERGNEIRQYFLDCETELKRRLQEDDKQKHWKVIKACVLPEPRKWEQMFPKLQSSSRCGSTTRSKLCTQIALRCSITLAASSA